MATRTKVRRITVKLNTPNPLFEKWLIEWRDQAKAKNSKMEFTFNNALKTLRKYPLPLNTGKDCIVLKGFGNTICSMLDKKLREYKQGNGSILNSVQTDNANEKPRTPKKVTLDKQKPSNSKTNKPYLPTKNSGAYAIIIALMKASQEPNYTGSLTKDELIERARPYSDKSFLKPDPGSYYTAWSSISTLTSKRLVERKGSPAKFSLTDEGEILAIQLLEDIDNENAPFLNKENEINLSLTSDTKFNSQDFQIDSQCSSINSEIINTHVSNVPSTSEITSSQCSSKASEAFSQTSSNYETIIFAPYTFDIILLVDKMETSGATQNPLHDETIVELTKLNTLFEVRHLKVGDFTWICRERTTNQELVLPYVVERKRMDDLGHSIRDGRFHEQKFRLKQSGIANLIYLVESYGSNTHIGLPLASLMQGATNTLIQDKFQVQFTENHRHSMQYLSGFTATLIRIFKNKTVISCRKEDLIQSSINDDLISLMTFNEFNKGASKTKKVKVKEVFIRQLLQLKGLSIEKALAIVEKYPTPILLKQELDRLGPMGEKLLANIQYGPLKKNIGPVVSKSIFQLFTLNNFP